MEAFDGTFFAFFSFSGSFFVSLLILRKKLFFFFPFFELKETLTGFVIECRLKFRTKRLERGRKPFCGHTGINRKEWNANKFFSLHRAESLTCSVLGLVNGAISCDANRTLGIAFNLISHRGKQLQGDVEASQQISVDRHVRTHWTVRNSFICYSRWNNMTMEEHCDK